MDRVWLSGNSQFLVIVSLLSLFAICVEETLTCLVNSRYVISLVFLILRYINTMCSQFILTVTLFVYMNANTEVILGNH